MSGSASDSGVDPELIAGWVTARSIARHLPAPVADHGGWRVDTRSDAEWSRYVFARSDSAIADLAQGIDRPCIYIKLCAATEVLMALLPAHWQATAESWVMVGIAPSVARRPLPLGYKAEVEEACGAITVSITTADGQLAASGYAAEATGVFVYDRIVTQPEHQRRGLGGTVMSLLSARCRSQHSRHVLVATAEGRALYTTLGWRAYAPYASAVIPTLMS